MLSNIRQQICSKRAQLTASFRNQAASQIANTIINMNIFKTSKNIAFYMAVNGEVDPSPLMDQSWSDQKICYLPVLANHQQLKFAKYNENERLINNRYEIPEPCYSSDTIIDPNQLDIVILPLVAFDNNGNRLGMGAGYYDRTLAFINQQPRPVRPYLIGIAYEFQNVPQLTPNTWDVSLNMVVTEHRRNKLCGIDLLTQP